MGAGGPLGKNSHGVLIPSKLAMALRNTVRFFLLHNAWEPRWIQMPARTKEGSAGAARISSSLLGGEGALQDAEPT